MAAAVYELVVTAFLCASVATCILLDAARAPGALRRRFVANPGDRRRVRRRRSTGSCKRSGSTSTGRCSWSAAEPERRRACPRARAPPPNGRAASQVFGRDKRWKRRPVDAATLGAMKTTASKRLLFIRHGESEWNLIFNKGSKALLPFKAIFALFREVRMFLALDAGSVLYDSPLNQEGLEQAQELAQLLRGDAHWADVPDPAARDADAATLRGGAGAPLTSVVASSNLRRALQTCVLALQTRIQETPPAGAPPVHVLSCLQEVSTNVDTISLAPPNAIPPLPRVPASLQQPDRFDAAHQSARPAPPLPFFFLSSTRAATLRTTLGTAIRPSAATASSASTRSRPGPSRGPRSASSSPATRSGSSTSSRSTSPRTSRTTARSSRSPTAASSRACSRRGPSTAARSSPSAPSRSPRSTRASTSRRRSRTRRRRTEAPPFLPPARAVRHGPPRYDD